MSISIKDVDTFEQILEFYENQGVSPDTVIKVRRGSVEIPLTIGFDRNKPVTLSMLRDIVQEKQSAEKYQRELNFDYNKRFDEG